jgi:hypothetical protein
LLIRRPPVSLSIWMFGDVSLSPFLGKEVLG